MRAILKAPVVTAILFRISTNSDFYLVISLGFLEPFLLNERTNKGNMLNMKITIVAIIFSVIQQNNIYPVSKSQFFFSYHLIQYRHSLIHRFSCLNNCSALCSVYYYHFKVSMSVLLKQVILLLISVVMMLLNPKFNYIVLIQTINYTKSYHENCLSCP